MRRVDLAEGLGLTPSGVTRLLDGLERQGLVAKGTCAADARVSYAVLTDAGARAARRASCSHVGSVRALFEERYSAEELETLARCSRSGTGCGRQRVIERSRASVSARTTSAGGSTSTRSRAVVDAALDGRRHAHRHGGHLRRRRQRALHRRDPRRVGGSDAVVATKFGMGEERRRRAGATSAARSTRRSNGLRTDYVDLLYYHRPDGVTPIAETVGAMNELVDAGKVRALGVSNVDAAQLREAVAAAPIAVVQNQYSLLERDAEAEMLPLCEELGVGFVPYFPLASGLLTGKYRRGEPAPAGHAARGPGASTTRRSTGSRRSSASRPSAGARCSTSRSARSRRSPRVVSVIAGATTPEQVRANAAAAGWRLTPEELAALP